MASYINADQYSASLGANATTQPSELVVFASASQTATQTSPDMDNANARGVIVVLDVTAAGTASLTLEIDGKDPAGGAYFALLTGAAVSTDSTNVYTVFPGATVTSNVSANACLPKTWRVVVTAADSNPATYSVGAILLP